MRFQDLPLNELREGAQVAVAIAAAAEAGLFAGLRAGAASAADLAGRLGLDARAVGIVLPILEQMGYVSERDGEFGLTEAGHLQLADPASPEYVGGGLSLWLENLRAWTTLPTVLRTGRPAVDHTVAAADEERIARFMQGMAARPRERVVGTVALCLERKPDARRVLDVGGGPGLYARSFLDAGVDEVVLLDMRPVIAHVADAYGLAGVAGLRLAAGDFTVDPMPAGPFDLALLSNVLHMLSPDSCRQLLARVRDVLAPGGVVAIGELVRGRSPAAVRFAAVMLLRTEGGNAWSEDDYLDWLAGAGFVDPRTEDIDADNQLITATRV